MKIVDPHMHLWEMALHRYPWLDSPSDGGVNGDYRSICQSYLLPDYRAESANFTVIKAVHVQAEIAPADSARETTWLQAVADDPASDWLPQGIVAFCDLAAFDAADVLAAHAEYKNLRGIRQILNTSTDPRLRFTPVDRLNDPAWLAGFALLGQTDWSFDLQIYAHQMADATRLARRYPSTRIILNHAGMPHDRSPSGMVAWREGMRALADCENTAVKISGLGMMDHGWSTDSIRPFVLDSIEIFGTDRACFASNFPVDGLFSSFDTLWGAFDDITSGSSNDDRDKLFRTTAETLYRI